MATVMVGLALVVTHIAPRHLRAQERGAAALGELVAGLGVNTRVLMIGAHPDDEDTFLITWLQRGRHVETAYLSLTRGDGGQNLIGNELGEALGVIRTQELLAARRIDGARQYFTRAFDFGFSKDTIDTYKHWQRDSVLGDVVRVVRDFRPHVIIAVFSGTPRDGHGHHQVSGLLARAAYDIAADTVRFSARENGAPWTPLKFYRLARFNAQNGTLGMDVGEYSPLLGRSYGEIAGESRSQHKSQGFGALQRKGPIIAYVRREASRVNEAAPAASEKSMFDGIDTSWARFKPGLKTSDEMRQPLAALPAQFAAVRAAYNPFAPDGIVNALGLVQASLSQICRLMCLGSELARDLHESVSEASRRADRALVLASGVTLEVTAERELAPIKRQMRVVATAYNRGRYAVTVRWSGIGPAVAPAAGPRRAVIQPGGVSVDTLTTMVLNTDEPRWLQLGRSGSMFESGSPFVEGSVPPAFLTARLEVMATHTLLPMLVPITQRSVDQVKGEVTRSAVGVPLIAVNLDATTHYAVANADFDRTISVRVRTADDSVRDVRVTLAMPKGLTVEGGTQTVRLAGYDRPATATFRVRGRLSPGEYRMDAVAEYDGETFVRGYDLIDYDHIHRQRIYRPASIRVSAVDVKVPTALRVAYVAGVGDNVAPTLTQLGIPTTTIAAGDVARADLTSYSTVVIGPRAYEAHPELLAVNPKLFDFARKGGTLVVQYGQYEMMQPGATLFPISINRPHDRVTEEDAAVTIDAPGAKELSYPNRIGASDFDSWVQERGLYMPRTFDPNYRSLLSMNDRNEPANRSAVLIAPLGDGVYVYTTLSFFRQLPAGVPGAVRLFVNLLSAKLAPPPVTP